MTTGTQSRELMRVAAERRRDASRHAARWALGAVLGLALLLRLPFVTSRSVWFDEAASWWTARLTPTELLGALRVDTTMPPYYLALKAWMQVFGDSVLSLRLSSISLGVLAVAAMYLFGIELWLASARRRRTHRGEAGGWLASPCNLLGPARTFALAIALGVALSPFQVNASIEVRMYALGTAATALSGWALLRAVRRGPCRRPWLVYSALAGFSLYVHPYQLFSVFAQFAFLFGLAVAWAAAGRATRYRRLIRRVLPSGVMVAIVFLPAVPLLVAQHAVVHKGFWIVPVNRQMLASTLAQFVVPTYVELRFAPYIEAAVLGAFLLGATAVVANRARRGDWFVLVSAFMPLALAALASLKTPVWEGRYFRFAHLYLVSLAVLAGWRLFSCKPKLLLTAGSLLVALGLAANIAFWELRAIPDRQGMRGALARLATSRREGELVVAESHLHFLPARYYLPTDVPVKLLEPGVGIGWARQLIDRRHLIGDQDLASAVQGGIWFIGASKLARESHDEPVSLRSAAVVGSFIEHYDRGVPDWPIHVSHCPGTEALRTVTEIDSAAFAEMDDADVARFRRMPWLRRLRLDRSAVGDRGLASISSLTNVVELSLAETRVTDAGHKELSALRRLESLSLAGDRISAKGAPLLARLVGLRRLNLARTFVNNTCVARIAAIQSLEDLDLDETLVSDAAVDDLARLPKLVRVSVRRTRVTAAGVERLRRARTDVEVCHDSRAE